MNHRVWLCALAAAGLSGCGRGVESGPPTVRLGETPCAQCGMIISDERFATASVFEGPRGPEARLFDDFNCQRNYEAEQSGETVVARWSHDHSSSAWITTEQAYFVRSPALRTPMASGMAAFGTAQGAESLRREIGGEVMRFDAAWAPPER